MAGKAIGYSDFYKGSGSKTPGSRISETPEYGTPETPDTDSLKKDALKRRLMRSKAKKPVKKARM